MDEELWKQGGSLQWGRLDAYHLTWARLTHFVADAQCSCHFHKSSFSVSSKDYSINGDEISALLQNLVHTLT